MPRRPISTFCTDGPALAWEYLRRHPDYRHDWLRRRRQPDAAGHWGCACWKIPLWMRGTRTRRFPDHDAVVQLYPDADPPPDALCFEFWKLPGHKHLIHDGKRLALVARWPGCCLRFVLAPAWPMAWLTSMPSGPAPRLANAMRPGERIEQDRRSRRCRTCGDRPATSAAVRIAGTAHAAGVGRNRRVRHCGRWPKGCLVWMPLPPTGTPTALCAPACGGWCAGPMG